MSAGGTGPGTDAGSATGVRLGLRANLAQFSLLVGVNALVGGMVGQERSLLPLLATDDFGVAMLSATLTLIAFGVTKAVVNLAAGALCDRFGRKPVMVAGWLVGVPVPLLIIFAPSWSWIVAANVLLGVNQGLTWSTAVIMKIDLAGPARRGLAMGLNEAAGYGAVAVTAWLTGYIAASSGLRPAPFLVGVAYAGLGLGLSVFAVRETRDHAKLEAATRPPDAAPRTAVSHGGAPHAGVPDDLLSTREVVWHTSVREPALSASSQAGLANNLNDGLAWILFPLLFASGGLTLGEIGTLTALYPATWSVGQLAFGPLSDRIGRKPLITLGMLLQAAALGGIALASTFTGWAAGMVLLGAGTALVYPTLLAAIGDASHPTWRATAVGVYRFWRDSGYAIGALSAGILASAFGLTIAVWAAAALTAASGAVVALRMYETHPPGRRNSRA